MGGIMRADALKKVKPQGLARDMKPAACGLR
jgi:hypothetical protein